MKTMAGKFIFPIIYFSLFFLFGGNVKLAQTSPLYSYPMESGKYRTNRVVVAEVDKPMDTVLEAVMELGGNIVLLVPQKDFEKRDPSQGPDLGTGRSYSGQRTANAMWGQLASNSPTGPGRRKRNSTDGGRIAAHLSNRELRSFREVKESFPQ